MGLTTEQRAKIDKLLDSLLWKIGGTILSLSGAGVVVCLPIDRTSQISLLCTIVLLVLLERLYKKNLSLRCDQEKLLAEIEILKAPLWEPDDEARTVLCYAVDSFPNRLQSFEFQEGLKGVLSDAKIELALDALDRNDYLHFDDGCSYDGQVMNIESYEVTPKGQVYVENWRRERGL